MLATCPDGFRFIVQTSRRLDEGGHSTNDDDDDRHSFPSFGVYGVEDEASPTTKRPKCQLKPIDPFDPR